MPERSDFDFGILYTQRGQAVFGMAAKICGRDHAADVTQDVFVELWQNPGRFHADRGSLRTYLLTIAHHKAVDHVRSGVARSARERRVPVEDLARNDRGGNGLLAQEDRVRVARALMTLTPDQRDAIVTAYFWECTYREAAVVLRQPEGTVKSRIQSGLMQLRVFMSGEMSQFDPSVQNRQKERQD
jgi:RNA polymerase sigma-70 factor (ECF subfamily)